MTKIKDLVEYVVHALADKPEEVEVNESVGEAVVAIEMRVASEDMGRIIGRRGRTINALRAVARILGAKESKRVTIELLE